MSPLVLENQIEDTVAMIVFLVTKCLITSSTGKESFATILERSPRVSGTETFLQCFRFAHAARVMRCS